MARCRGASMRITHVVPCLDPSYGGPVEVAIGLACAQATRGHRVRLIAAGSQPPAGSPTAENAARLSAAGVVVSILPSPGVAGFLFGRLGTAAEGCELLHVHGIWDPILLAAARGARHADVPYVLSLHGMVAPRFLRQKRLKKWIGRTVAVNRLMREAAICHTMTAIETGDLRAILPDSRIVELPNGVASLPNLDQFRGRFRASHGLGSGPVVLFLSRLHHEKGLDMLAEAFARLLGAHPDAQLVVAGPDFGAEPELRQMCAHLGIGARVHIPGPLYGQKKLHALADASCFVLPSRSEGFSIAALEALSAGLPTVLTEGCNFSAAGRAGAAVVVETTAEGIHEGLRRVLDDPEAAGRMAASAREFVRMGYTWPAITQRLDEALQGIVRQVGSRTSA